jgi:uncharacterized protein (DUF1684 family)
VRNEAMNTRSMAVATLSAIGVAVLLSLGGSVQPAKAEAVRAEQDAELIKELETYRKRRAQGLAAPDGWTSIIGMHWLEPGRYTIGSAKGNDVLLAIGPARIGVVEEKDGQAVFTPEPDVSLTVEGAPLTAPVELQLYSRGKPATTVAYDGGKGLVTVIVSGKRRALRVRHSDAPARLNFAGLDFWPFDASWRVKGRFVPHQPARVVEVLDVLGGLNDQANPGVVVFERDGKRFQLEVIGDSSRGLSLMFADRTNGKGSYPAGRFLFTELPDANGEVLIDFNRAYTPPCAFTEFGTCLLPPPENRLDLAITAGEKTYSKGSALL